MTTDARHPDRARRGRPVRPWAAVLAGVALVALVWAVYHPALGHGFIEYDEQAQVVRNPLVRSLSPGNLARIFSSRSDSSYYPVRLLSFAVDYAVWDLDPTGYHLTNLLLHAANVLLLYGLALRLLRRRRRPDSPDCASRAGGGVWPAAAAALGAGLFALHPVVVEPVAWVGGREELLMVFGALACLHCHLRARRSERAAGRVTGRAVAWHGGAVLGGIVACGSNVVGAAVPAVVTVYDLLSRPRPPARRIAGGTALLWLIGIGAIAAKVTEPITSASRALRVAPSAFQRMLVVLAVYWEDLRTLLWPEDLTVRYPWAIPSGPLSPRVLVGAAAVAVTAAGVVLAYRRRRRLAAFGLAWFVLALLPTLQIVPHHVYRADRFLYLPLAGAAVVVAAGLGAARRPATRGMAAGLVGALLIVWGRLSAAQLPVWQDSLTLFGRHVTLHPDSATGHYNLGTVLGEGDQVQEAVRHYRMALEANPDHPGAHNNLGTILFRKGDAEGAIRHYESALAAYEHYFPARYNLGNALSSLGRHAEALPHYRAVVAADPSDAEAHFRLADALFHHGDAAEAVTHYRRSIELRPRDPEAHSNLAGALLVLGRPDEAARACREALRINPRFPQAHYNLGGSLAAQGRFRRAIESFERALRLRPDYERALAALARLLAACPDPEVRDPARAVTLAEELCRRTAYADPEYLGVLAAAYAAAGRPDEALRAAESAVELARERGNAAILEQLRLLVERINGRTGDAAAP